MSDARQKGTATAANERNGKVMIAAPMEPKDEIMLITTGDVLIPAPVAGLREMTLSRLRTGGEEGLAESRHLCHLAKKMGSRHTQHLSFARAVMVHLLRLKLFVFLTFFVALTGCSMTEDYALAEGEIPGFHILFNEKKFNAIYDASGKGMQELVSKKDFSTFLEGMHRKLGVMISSKPQSKGINYHTSGTLITLIYVTEYEKGEATEQFTYKLEGGTALLHGYHVNSNAFVIQ